MSEDVKLGIVSTADTAGIDKTAESLDKLDAKAKTAGKGTVDAGKGLGILGQAAGAASGSLASVAGLLGGLTQKIPAFAGAAAMATGAIYAWVDAVGKINAAIETQGKNLRDIQIQAANFDNDVRRLTESYDELTASIDKAAKATSDLAAVDAEKRAADREASDAALDLEEQQAIAGLSPDDEIGRRRIEAGFAARRAALGATRQGEDAQAKADALRAQAETERARAAAADEQAKAMFGAAGSAQARASDLLDVQRRAMERAWTPAGVVKAQQTYQPEVERANSLAADLLAASKEQRHAAELARSAAEMLERRAEIAERGVATAGVRGRAADVAASVTASEIDADRAKRDAEARKRSEAASEAERLRGALGVVESDVAEARRRAAFESADVDRAREAYEKAEATPGKSGRLAKDRELEALRKALAREQQEAREAIAAAARIIEEAAKSSKDLQQRLRQAESRARSSSGDEGQGD